MKKNILIFGGYSTIAINIVKYLYKYNKSYNFILIGSSIEKLNLTKQKLVDELKDIKIIYNNFNALNDDPKKFISNIFLNYENIYSAIICFGTLPNQKNSENNTNYLLDQIKINFTCKIQIFLSLAENFKKQRFGQIVYLGSVAGDRGRKSNYLYGSMKASLFIFLQGLRNKLSKYNVNILYIKLGFVKTNMTIDFKKNFLWSDPDYVSKKIIKAMLKRKDIVFIPFWWRYIMLMIKMVPEKIFKYQNKI